jgi:hypothetical protein
MSARTAALAASGSPPSSSSLAASSPAPMSSSKCAHTSRPGCPPTGEAPRTWNPRSLAMSAAATTSVVLPDPWGPTRVTTPPEPAAAVVRSASSSASSAARPTGPISGSVRSAPARPPHQLSRGSCHPRPEVQPSIRMPTPIPLRSGCRTPTGQPPSRGSTAQRQKCRSGPWAQSTGNPAPARLCMRLVLSATAGIAPVR